MSAPTLERIGREAYYEFRAALMMREQRRPDRRLTTASTIRTKQTRDIIRLRELHAAMDRAVLDAYGWTDIGPTCEFLLDYEIDEEDWGKKKKPYRYRWPDDVRDEVLGRLLALNAERAAAEQSAGSGSSKPAPKRKKAKAANPSLLDEGV